MVSFLLLDVDALHLKLIFSLELVSKIVSCPSTSRSINKSIGSICCDKVNKDQDLWSISEFVGCFGFGGNFGGILLSLICALLALLILSVMLVVELYFDDVTDLLGMRYFSLISLSILCFINSKLLLVLSTCVFDMPSKSRLLSLQILPFLKFSANLINCNLF